MGIVKKLREADLVGGVRSQSVYPVTSTIAVFDTNGKSLDAILEQLQAGEGGVGISPHIGENGNWFIGTTDTGVKAAGEDGIDGITPIKGVDYFTAEEIENITINAASKIDLSNIIVQLENEEAYEALENPDPNTFYCW